MVATNHGHAVYICYIESSKLFNVHIKHWSYLMYTLNTGGI